MNILVIGGTGTVGSATVAALMRGGSSVAVMTRSAEKKGALPAGVRGVIGTMSDRTTLAGAMKGVDALFLITPVSPAETTEGLNAVEAAKASGVRKIVYLSVQQADKVPDAPHFAGKIPIENAIKSSGIPFVILRPNNFFQNDYMFQQGLLAYGVYAQPIGNRGLHRVDVRDIADAAVHGLTKNDFNGGTYTLAGAELLTGDGVASYYARALGKKVIYAGDDLEVWSAQAKKMLPEWMVEDFTAMYRYFQLKGLVATAEELAASRSIIGKEPRSFGAFVNEVTTLWKKQ
jgi:uncharacterized protein YbjT (DUF2867 family)